MVKKMILTVGALLLLFPAMAFADAPSTAMLNTGLNSLWVMLAAILVILMQGGFILLEAGSTRMKNAGHVAGKTIFTFGLGSLIYWAVGYGIAFGENGNLLYGLGKFFYNPPVLYSEDAGLSDSVFFYLPACVCYDFIIYRMGRLRRARQAFILFDLYHCVCRCHLSDGCPLDLGRRLAC